MTWIITVEADASEFYPTSEEFEGTMEEVNDHLTQLNQQRGVCHAATAAV